MPAPEEELNLSTLKPAQKRKARKRVGRGMGSGKGRYSGRGIKGQKSRSGSHTMRPGFEGGQMPAYMRLGKQRGATSKDAMPIGPFRTSTIPVNVRDLEQGFEADDDVTPEALVARRIVRKKGVPVKVLGNGELTKKLTVTAHAFSATAREKIEAAGGTVVVLDGGPAPKKRGRAKAKKETDATAAADPDAAEAVEVSTPRSEPGADAEDSEE